MHKYGMRIAWYLSLPFYIWPLAWIVPTISGAYVEALFLYIGMAPFLLYFRVLVTPNEPWPDRILGYPTRGILRTAAWLGCVGVAMGALAGSEALAVLSFAGIFLGIDGLLNVRERGVRKERRS